MQTFFVTLQRKLGDAWPVVAEHNRSGDLLPVRAEGTFHLDLTDIGKIEADPKSYGTALGSALFRDDVRDAFSAARREAEDRLHVLLFIEADELKVLRWERLCAPLDFGWDFLSLDQRFPYSRYLASRFDRRYPLIGRSDLRALVLAASPSNLEEYNLAPFDVPAHVAGLRTSLGDIPVDALADTQDAIGNPTLDDLCNCITSGKYTLLHLFCHGKQAGEGGDTVLYLSDSNGKADPVTGTRFLERLSRLYGTKGLPQVFFLASCESAAPGDEKSLGGLAQRLVRDLGTPAVIAMTDRVSIATASALAAEFYRFLLSHGAVDLALVEACAALAERMDITVPALFSRLAGRPIFSDLIESPLSATETIAGLERMQAAFTDRAPVLLPVLDAQVTNLRPLLATGKEALNTEKQNELRNGLGEIEALCDQVLDINFRALAKGTPFPDYDARCPFRGLYPFHTEDLEFFFGREVLVERLLERLMEHGFLAVLGPSGSGKSSLVLAGVIPALRKQRPELALAYMTPGSAPLANLEASLSQVGDQPHVLVVDQFEEVFTLVPDEGQRKSFLEKLLPIAECCPVILTMRADFWGECAPYPELKAAMQAHQELIAPMDAVELRRAMEMQAAAVKLRFEAGLSLTILDDVRDEPGAMPLLQHALQELWKQRHGSLLLNTEYEAIGGVKKAIARTADTVYFGLPERQREELRSIFMRLTRLDDEVGLGGEKRDTRRRASFDELSPSLETLPQMRSLLNELATARLVVTSLNNATGKEEVEVAHEALIRSWPRLRDWLQEDREALLLRDQLRREALQWQQRNRDSSYLLLFGARLKEYAVLVDHPRVGLNELERAYLVACRENEEKRSVLQNMTLQNISPEAAGLVRSMSVDFDLMLEYQAPEGENDLPRLNFYLGRFARQARPLPESPTVRSRLSLDLGPVDELQGDGIAYGQRLTEGFFSSHDVRTYFANVNSQHIASGSPLRTCLWIDPNEPELHRIAWETLQEPQSNLPLFNRENIWLARMLTASDFRVHSRRELHALIATACPADLRNYDLTLPAKEIQVQQAKRYLGSIASHGLEAANTTLENLLTSLREQEYQIVLLSCPVHVVRDEPWLLLEDDHGDAKPVSSAELSDGIRSLQQKPWLIVLHPLAEAKASPIDSYRQLAPRLVEAGVLAVLVLPEGVPEESLETFTGVFFTELQKDGLVDRALAWSCNSVRNQPGWWRYTLYTSVDDARLWYTPGFGNERDMFEKWPAILRSLNRSSVTPILGPGLVEPYLGWRDDIARKWADVYAYPSATGQKAVLSQVAQYLSVNQYEQAPYDELEEYTRIFIQARFGAHLSSNVADGGKLSIAEWIDVAWNSIWSRNPNEAHHLLARLPLRVYLTTNFDDLLALALREAGKAPEIILCPWNEYIEQMETIYNREPDYRPSEERPLVYHFFGRFVEPDSMVLTEDDSFRFAIGSQKYIDLWPSDVRRAVADSATLYLGHRYEDQAFQTLFKSIESLNTGRFRDRYPHIFQDEPPMGANSDRIRRYQEESMARRGISVYWGEVQDIVNEIKTRIQSTGN